MQINSIIELEAYLSEKKLNIDLFSSFLDRIISGKKLSFSRDYVGEDFEFFKKHSIIKGIGKEIYELNYDSFILQYCILKYAEKYLESSLPKSLKESIAFGDKFLFEIRKPKTNHHWYGTLNMKFLEFIIKF